MEQENKLNINSINSKKLKLLFQELFINKPEKVIKNVDKAITDNILYCDILNNYNNTVNTVKKYLVEYYPEYFYMGEMKVIIKEKIKKQKVESLKSKLDKMKKKLRK